MSTTFWNLCPDLMLELCNYFSIDEIYFSLYPDVLPYVFELLAASHKRLHLGLTNDHLLTGMLLSLINIERTISLRLSSCDIPLDMFNTVKTLILHNVENVNTVLSKRFILPSLQRLVLIYSHHQSYLIENVLKQAFTRPALTYLRLQSNETCLSTLNNLFDRSFSIKQLTLNVSCSYVIMNVLLHSLPNLRILRIRTLMNVQQTTERNQVRVNRAFVPPTALIHHSSLEILDLVWYHPTIAIITALLTGLSNLKQFRLSGAMNYQELDGKFWYYLITRISQHILRMNVNMLIWTGMQAEEIKNDFEQDAFFELINFKLLPSDKEKELFVLFRNFRRSA